MNQPAIKQIAKQLRDIVSNTSKPESGSLSNFQMHDGVAYNWTSEAAISFNEIVGKILKQKDFSQKFSSKYVDQKLKTLFAELLSDEKVDLEEELVLLISALSSFEQNTVVFLKIEGIVLSLCFELGRVRFVPGDQHLIFYIKNEASKIIKSSRSNEEGKNFYHNFISQQAEAVSSGGCVGIVEVNAEPIRAFEVAKEEVRRAIDVLRFSSKAIYPLKEDIRIGLEGDHPRSNRHGFVFSEAGLNTKSDSVGSVRPFEIKQESLERMNDVGVFEISSALRKKQANNFEESLIRSIHWFSVALTQSENSNSFLFLVVALESLFKAERGNSIGGTVAESVAFLVSDNLTGRKRIVSLVREYYGKRSGVAHGGKKTITDADLCTLINITGTSIMVAIEKLSEFTSQKQFMGWIEDQKLT